MRPIILTLTLALLLMSCSTTRAVWEFDECWEYRAFRDGMLYVCVKEKP